MPIRSKLKSNKLRRFPKRDAILLVTLICAALFGGPPVWAQNPLYQLASQTTTGESNASTDVGVSHRELELPVKRQPNVAEQFRMLQQLRSFVDDRQIGTEPTADQQGRNTTAGGLDPELLEAAKRLFPEQAQLLEQFGDQISPADRARIRQLLGQQGQQTEEPPESSAEQASPPSSTEPPKLDPQLLESLRETNPSLDRLLDDPRFRKRAEEMLREFNRSGTLPRADSTAQGPAMLPPELARENAGGGRQSGPSAGPPQADSGTSSSSPNLDRNEKPSSASSAADTINRSNTESSGTRSELETPSNRSQRREFELDAGTLRNRSSRPSARSMPRQPSRGTRGSEVQSRGTSLPPASSSNRTGSSATNDGADEINKQGNAPSGDVNRERNRTESAEPAYAPNANKAGGSSNFGRSTTDGMAEPGSAGEQIRNRTSVEQAKSFLREMVPGIFSDDETASERRAETSEGSAAESGIEQTRPRSSGDAGSGSNRAPQAATKGSAAPEMQTDQPSLDRARAADSEENNGGSTQGGQGSPIPRLSDILERSSEDPSSLPPLTVPNSAIEYFKDWLSDRSPKKPKRSELLDRLKNALPDNVRADLKERGLDETLSKIVDKARDGLGEQEQEQAVAAIFGDENRDGSKSLQERMQQLSEKTGPSVSDSTASRQAAADNRGQAPSTRDSASKQDKKNPTQSIREFFKDLTSPAEEDKSQATASASGFSTPGFGVSSRGPVIGVLILSLAVLGWWLWSLRRSTVSESASSGVLADFQIVTREDVVRAFHLLAQEAGGHVENWWTHQRMASLLTGQKPASREHVEALARLYEIARYQPWSTQLSERELQDARRAMEHLRTC